MNAALKHELLRALGSAVCAAGAKFFEELGKGFGQRWPIVPAPERHPILPPVIPPTPEVPVQAETPNN